MSLLMSLLDDDLLGRPVPSSSTQQGPPVTKREIYFNIRRDGFRGDGTTNNPFDGGIPDRLDAILNGDDDSGVGENTRIIFGPGIFRTRGPGRRAAPKGNWLGVKKGQEFIGAGMFATTLRLELVFPTDISNPLNRRDNTSYGVFDTQFFGLGQMDDVLIQDMTIDCNLQGQPNTPPYDWPRIMVGAIWGDGNRRVRIRRVRIINAGTGTPYYDFEYNPGIRNSPVGLECFPLYQSAWYSRDAQDNVIEECIIEQPYHSSGRETTFIHIGGGADNQRQRGYNDRAGVRECLVDCAIVTPGPFPEIQVESFLLQSLQATVTTMRQHDLKTGDRVRIRAPSGYNQVGTVQDDSGNTQWKVLIQFPSSPGTPTGNITAEKISKPPMLVSLG